MAVNSSLTPMKSKHNIANLLDERFEDFKSYQDSKFEELRQEFRNIVFKIENSEFKTNHSSENKVKKVEKGKKFYSQVY